MENWPDSEQLLSRVRQWLDQTRAEADSLDDQPPGDVTPAEQVGLFQLVERLTALRHEVKLLTKVSRGTEERNEATLVSMQAAIEQFRSAESDTTQAARKASLPLVEGLADLDESLNRGRIVIENARRRATEEAGGELSELRRRFEELYRLQPWWRRALCRPWHAAIMDIYDERSLETSRGIFDSLLEGYDLIGQRLKRTMDTESIIRMTCVGRQFDPNSMTVIETVSDSGRPPGLVVEEMRPGYYWKTKVLRFAEVKVIGER